MLPPLVFPLIAPPLPAAPAVPALAFWLLMAYFAAVLLLARVFSRRIVDLKGFFLAGRQLGPWPVGVAFTAAWFGAGSTMGSINAFYHHGLSGLWAVIIPSALSCLVITLWMARRVARQTELSQPEAVEKHFGRAGRLLLSVIILISTINFVASQMVAAGQLFERVFQVDVLSATLLCTAVVVTYAMLGGYLAVVVTDHAQLVMVGLGLLILAGFSVAALGEPGALEQLANLPASYWRLSGDGETPLAAHLALTLSFVLAWSIAPEMWQRMSSTPNPELARQAGFRAMAILGALFLLVLAIGLSSRAMLAEATPGGIVLVDLVLRLPHPVLVSLALIGFIAAVTSTMDSSINVGSLTLTQDLYRGFLRPEASERELLWAGRLATVLVTLPAIAIAVSFQDIIHVLWMSADVFASAMFVPITALLFLARPSRLGGVWAMAAGLSMAGVSAAFQYQWLTGPAFWPVSPYSTLWGVLASLAAYGAGAWVDAARKSPGLGAAKETSL